MVACPCACPLAGGSATWAQGDRRAGTAIAAPPTAREHQERVTEATPVWPPPHGKGSAKVKAEEDESPPLSPLLCTSCLTRNGYAAGKQEKQMQPSSCFARGFGVEGATEMLLLWEPMLQKHRKLPGFKKRTQGIMLFQAREGRKISLPFSSLSHCHQQQNHISSELGLAPPGFTQNGY